MGFPVPLNDWFGGRFRNYARDMLLGGRSTERGMYNALDLKKIVTENELSENHALAMKVLMLVNLDLFRSSYIDTDSSARLA